MVSCGFPRSYYDEGQPAGCRHAFITDAAANGFFEHVGSGIAGHLLLATCGVSHPPAAVSDCTRCAEHSWNTIFIYWFIKIYAIPLRHSRSASVRGRALCVHRPTNAGQGERHWREYQAAKGCNLS
jgi:hypothetical protein